MLRWREQLENRGHKFSETSDWVAYILPSVAYIHIVFLLHLVHNKNEKNICGRAVS